MNVDYTAFGNELEKIDLGDTLSTLIVKQPGFINLFPTKAPAKALRHEWLEDSLKPKEVAYLSATAEGVFAFEEAKGAKAFEKGDYVAIKGKTATLKVVAVDESAKTVTTTFVAANGSGLAASTLPTEAGTLQFLYHPIAEGSEDGPQKGGKSGKNHNFTQIVRAKVKLSGSLLAIQTHGLENTVIAQSKRALIDVARELDKIAVFGTRAERDVDDECGRAGGLYDFGLSDGAAEVDASPGGTASPLSYRLINDAAEEILNAGARPNAIICGPGQKRVLASLMASQITLSPGDRERGGTVDSIICDLTGEQMRIVVDYNVPDSDVWVVDTDGFGLAPLAGRWGIQKDTTTPRYDGVELTILNEFTLEFKNAAARLARITNLKDSAAFLS